MRFRPITIALSPNTESDDVWLAAKIIWKPGMWKAGSSISMIEQWFSEFFSTNQAISFNSGRSAMLAILKAFDIGAGDEVLVQAFTCVAVPNSVFWAGAVPVYVDIDDTLNMDPKDAEKKITKKTKAIIVQHTFGVPAQMDKFVSLAKKHNLILIEDCAHALGATYKGKKVGSIGDAAFFSFGRDKVISSIFGGMVIIQTKFKSQNEKLKEYQEKLPYPSQFWIFQQLLHPVAFSSILATYNIYLGKALLVFLQKLHLLSFPVYQEEKKGERPTEFPKKFPNALAILALHQLKKLDRYNNQRKTIARIYRNALSHRKEISIIPDEDGAMYLRFPIFMDNPFNKILSVRKMNIYLGNWYHNVIDPRGVDFEAIKYEQGSCPKAEEAATRIINLPTRISSNQAQDVLRSLL